MEITHRDLGVMVDANILIAGSVWPRWPYEVLQHALRGDFQLVLSDYILQQALIHIRARVDYLVSEDKDLTVQDETTVRLRQ
jgi:predicted nucleic acid-binding protein